MSEVDLLETDPIQVPNQHYALITVVSSKDDKNHAVKIRGVFNTIEEAQKHAQQLHACDPNFDIIVAELYKWLQIPPNRDDIENQVHSDENLNQIIKAHKDEKDKVDAFFAQRKSDLMEGKIDPVNIVNSEDPVRIKE